MVIQNESAGAAALAKADLPAAEIALGQRHVQIGQRQVGHIPDLVTDVATADIVSVAVVGGGLMGTGIATVLLGAGLKVTLIEIGDEARARAVDRIEKSIQRDIEKDRISEAQGKQHIANLTPSNTLEGAAHADLVIEAVFEEVDVKRDVFSQLNRITKPTAILASNTSGIDLDVIASFTDRPGQVVGLHFFSPATVMKLVEIVRGKATSPEVLATALSFVQKINKVGVVAGVCDGFIGNRIFEEYLRQAYFLLEEGALPQQIDRALETWGLAMGPMRTMDLAGQDVGWSVRKRRLVTQPDRPYSRIPDLICEMGRYGQKTGKGYYVYKDGRTAEVDPEIDRLIIDYSEKIGVKRREISDAEIVDRCILAMVNEGAHVVADGIAYRPIDVDVTYLYGYGFPAERGGPMFYADRIGLPTVLKKIKALEGGYAGWSWTPAPLLVDLVGKSASFGSLNDAGDVG